MWGGGREREYEDGVWRAGGGARERAGYVMVGENGKGGVCRCVSR